MEEAAANALAEVRPQSARRRSLTSQLEPWLYLAPSLVLMGLFIFYPTLRSIYLSLFMTDALGRPRLFAGGANFSNALSSLAFLHSLGNSLLFVVYTVPVGIALALILALLTTKKMPGIKLFQLVFSSPLCISVATGATIFSMMYNPISGVINWALTLVGLPKVAWLTQPGSAMWAVGFVSIWMRLGFNYVLLLSGLQNVPQELHDAARVDGAGTWAQIRHVTLPMLSPTLFFAAVVGVIHAFQAFGEIDILTSGGPANATNVVVYQIYQEAFQNFRFGSASAQALILFAIILVLTYVQFKLGERQVHYQ